MSRFKDRTGERKLMNCGYWCEIIEYRHTKDTTVRFDESGYIISVAYDNFKRGKVEDKLQPTICGVGIVGDNKTVDDNGKALNSYKVWTSMLTRCYEKNEDRNPTYDDCYVCDEWKYYDNFKKWYNENFYEIDNKKMCLDKDILSKGNKVYSPDTCVFVPSVINLLFVRSQKTRGEFPIGVSRSKGDKFRASISISTEDGKYKTKSLGTTFHTPEEAFDIYKAAKEEYIKYMADKYKSKIPKRLYDAMYEYKVEIND